MCQELVRGARVVALAAAFVGLPLSALAQQSPALAEAALAGSQVRGGPVRQISVDDAVRLALEQNLGIQVARLGPQLQDLSIAQVRGAWVPALTGSASGGSSNSPVSNIFAGATTKLTNNQFLASVGISQLLPWGGNYLFGWETSRLSSNNMFSTLNPTLGSGLSFTVTQPLVRNFKIDSTRQQLLVSKKGREISDVQLRQSVLNTTRGVRNAYWDLSYAVSSLEVQRQSLQLAQRSLKDARSKVGIGTMAPIDIIEAQAEVAAREEAVIVAEAGVDQSEDVLRALIFDPKTPDFWAMKLELTDSPSFQARPIDLDAAVQNALGRRTDIIQARKSLEQRDITIKYYRNQTLPDVTLQAAYSASARGGTEYSVSYPNPLTTFKERIGYGSVLRSLFSQDFPVWSFGVQVGYPIGKSGAELGLTRTRLERNQAETQLRNLELQVATQVRSLGRQVNTNVKRVDATRAARELAEKRLSAEEKKLAAGISTSFLVFQAQRDLAQARNAELSAILDYNRSLVNFEAGQEAPIGGGGVSIGTSGGTSGGQN